MPFFPGPANYQSTQGRIYNLVAVVDVVVNIMLPFDSSSSLAAVPKQAAPSRAEGSSSGVLPACTTLVCSQRPSLRSAGPPDALRTTRVYPPGVAF
jgi:hypothetical protein